MMAHLPPDPGRDLAGEPLLSVGGLTALVTAALSLLVAFGLPLTDKQDAAILAFVAILAPVVVAVIGRGRVWSPKSVARLIGRRPPTSVGVLNPPGPVPPDPPRTDKTLRPPGSE
jgi:hypothetical protein